MIDFNKTVILDGSITSELRKHIRGADWICPEICNIINPELVYAIHSEYVAAGADIIFANTFGANMKKLPVGIGVDYVIKEAVTIAKSASLNTAPVALSIGEIGDGIEPKGDLTFDETVETYKYLIKSGISGGADIISFESFTDLLELKAAIVAAKETTVLPIFATMIFEKNCFTTSGVSMEAMAITLEALGVTALGISYSAPIDEVAVQVEELTKVTALPIIIKATDDWIETRGGGSNKSDKNGLLLKYYTKFQSLGVNIFGGWRGSMTGYSEAVSTLKGGKVGSKTEHNYLRVCSDGIVVDGVEVRVVGERLNPTGKKLLKKALIMEDYNYIFHQAAEQIEAGADILDVNCCVSEVKEIELLPRLIKKLQEFTKTPLQIDSINAEAVELACRYYNGKPIINSVNGSHSSIRKILPIAKKYGAAIVALAMSGPLPKNKDERVLEIKKIIKEAAKIGIPKKDIIADCLTLTAASAQNQAQETLRAVEEIRKLGVSATLGVSNISFGMPNRDVFTSIFLAEAFAKGLNFPIINPNSYPVMITVWGHKVLNCEDADSMKFLEFCKKNAETRISATPVSITPSAQEVIAPIDDKNKI